MREGNDEAVCVILPTKDYIYFFYSSFCCELGFGDGVYLRDEFLGGERTIEGVDGEGVGNVIREALPGT